MFSRIPAKYKNNYLVCILLTGVLLLGFVVGLTSTNSPTADSVVTQKVPEPKAGSSPKPTKKNSQFIVIPIIGCLLQALIRSEKTKFGSQRETSAESNCFQRDSADPKNQVILPHVGPSAAAKHTPDRPPASTVYRNDLLCGTCALYS